MSNHPIVIQSNRGQNRAYASWEKGITPDGNKVSLLVDEKAVAAGKAGRVTQELFYAHAGALQLYDTYKFKFLEKVEFTSKTDEDLSSKNNIIISDNDLSLLKEAKKQACDSISVCNKLISKEMEKLKNEVNKDIFSKIISILWKSGLFNNLLFSISPDTCKKVNKNLKEQKELKHSLKDLVVMQNKILDKHAEITKQWRPEEVTTKSIIERMKEPEVKASLEKIISYNLDKNLETAISNCYKNGLLNGKKKEEIALEKAEIRKKYEVTEKRKKDHLKRIMDNLEKLSGLDLNKKGLIKLSDDFDLIVTDKRNYYIVFKSKDLKLGSGCFKNVYPGLDLTKGRAIAVGYALKRCDIDEKFYCGVTGKIKTASNDHVINDNKEKILHYIDYLKCEGGGSIFISELCKESVYSYIDNGKRLEIKNKIKMCSDTIDLMEEMISKEWCYRDFKIDNLLIFDDKMNLKLCDFGNSYTPSLLPPEIQRGDLRVEDYDEKALVWAMGIAWFQIYFEKTRDPFFYIAIQRKHGINNESEYQKFRNELGNEDIIKLIDSSIRRSNKNDPFAEVIKGMLNVDPNARLSLKDAALAWKDAARAWENGNSSLLMNE